MCSLHPVPTGSELYRPIVRPWPTEELGSGFCHLTLPPLPPNLPDAPSSCPYLPFKPVSLPPGGRSPFPALSHLVLWHMRHILWVYTGLSPSAPQILDQLDTRQHHDRVGVLLASGGEGNLVEPPKQRMNQPQKPELVGFARRGSSSLGPSQSASLCTLLFFPPILLSEDSQGKRAGVPTDQSMQPGRIRLCGN